VVTSIARKGFLRKEHYLAGYTVDLEDHVITLRRNGQVIDHYGINTPIETIHHDVDQMVEREKAFQIEAVSVIARIERDDNALASITSCPKCGHEHIYSFWNGGYVDKHGCRQMIVCDVCGMRYEAIQQASDK
jgi:hypothetical protein